MQINKIQNYKWDYNRSIKKEHENTFNNNIFFDNFLSGLNIIII